MKTILSFLANVLLAGLLAAALTPFISSWLDQKHYQLEWKRDVFTRLVGNRHFLSEACRGKSRGEPFIALNEMFAAFDDSPSVIDALRTYHSEINMSANRKINNLLTLIKLMAKSSGISLNDLNDSFLTNSFIPKDGCAMR